MLALTCGAVKPGVCACMACIVHLVRGLSTSKGTAQSASVAPSRASARPCRAPGAALASVPSVPCPRPAARAGDWADLQERGAGAWAAGEAPLGQLRVGAWPRPSVASSLSSSVVPVVPRSRPASWAVPVVPTSSRNPPHASQATLGDKQLEGSHPHSYMRRFMSQLSMTQKEFTWGEALTLALLPQVGGWAGPAGMSPVLRGGCIVQSRRWCTHGKLGR